MSFFSKRKMRLSSFAGLLLTLFIATSCAGANDPKSDDQTTKDETKTGQEQTDKDPTSTDPKNDDSELYNYTEEELSLLSSNISVGLNNLHKETAKAFKPSSTPPKEGAEIRVVNEKYNHVFWYDKNSKIIYYYSPDGSKLSFGKETNKTFLDCRNMEEIDLSGFDSRNVTNMKEMFLKCCSLKKLTFSNLDTSKVTSMSGMFEYCESLESIDLSSFDTSKVTDMNSMFSNCKSLKELDISNFDTSNVTKMNEMFWDCENLTKIVFGEKFNTSKVTDMHSMFSTCKKLTSIDLSKFKTNLVTDMHLMFKMCSAITELDLSNFNFSSVTTTEKMFAFDTSLTTIICPKNTDLSSIKLDDINKINSNEMFLDCTSLVGGKNTKYDEKNITAEYARIDGGTDKPGYFTESTKTVEENPSEENPIVNPMTTEELEAQSKTIKQALKDLDVKNATAFKPSLTAPAEGTETKVINEKLNQVFWKEGTEIYYYSPDGSKISFGTDASELFYSCEKIKEIDLSGFDTSDVTTMYRLFRECKALETLDVSLFNTNNVTNMGYMFSGCRNLKSIDVSRFNTSKVTNMSSMFSDCYKLESIDLNSFKTNKVTNMNAMFASCHAIKEIDVTMFDTSKVTDMFQMFTFCESITELDVSSFDVTKVEKGKLDRMFYHCTNLRTIYAKNDAVWKNLTCNDVFTDCTALVGGNGTKYNANNTKYTYARVDGYEGKKGYFTGISMKPNDKEITPETQSKFIRGAINFFEISKARAFKPSSTAPADGIETKTVNGQLKQVIWKDKDIIYYYSPDGSKISLGNDASKLFADGGYMLREIDLSGFDTSDVTNMSQMFYNCSGLTSLNISSFDTSNVTDMKKMFSSCTSLTSLDVSSFKTDRVETMEYMFYACSKLTKLDLSNFETKKVTNMNYMFDSCDAITEIIFSNNFDVSHVTDLSHMFRNCKALKKLDVSNFKTYSATDMGWMFCNCSSLTELDISNFHVTIETKVYSLFENCSSLKTIYCSSGTDWSGIYKDTSYNGIFQGTLPTMDMFKGCTSLVGGEGTKFIDSKIREEYARFDGRNGNSGDGYFTVKK